MKSLFEDGFKLFGIVSWFGYFVRVCFQVVKYAILQPTELTIRAIEISKDTYF